MRYRRLTAMAAAVLMITVTGCGQVGKMIDQAVSETGNKTEPEAKLDMTMEAESYDVNAPMLSIGFTADTPLERPFNTEEYNYIDENSWRNVAASPLSTFAADVDTASYANLRRMILGGDSVPADAVRVEEMINYFSYKYPEPVGDEPFSVTTEIAPCPWNEQTKLLLVGLRTKAPEELPPSNLVFLIDVSGSMSDPDKLPLVQRAFRLLADQLGENDHISIVTYASSDQVVLDGVTGDQHETITSAIEDLQSGGGTDGSRGIQTAYELAEKHFIEGGNNRVILATDGDLNLGITDQGGLTRLIEEKAKGGTFLSVLGFGEGNLSDANLESIADHGNGNYHYIDDIAEARKVLIEEAGGNLQTVAKDVKLQLDFNGALINCYRQIGYEDRALNAEDFADDTKDGGEIGAGHSVTALYEIAEAGSGFEVPEVTSRYAEKSSEKSVDESSVESSDEAETEDLSEQELLTVSVRWKDPDASTSQLAEFPVTADHVTDEASEDLTWAAGVAQTAMILRNSEFKGDATYADVKEQLEDLSCVKGDAYREEFIYLLGKLARMD